MDNRNLRKKRSQEDVDYRTRCLSGKNQLGNRTHDNAATPLSTDLVGRHPQDAEEEWRPPKTVAKTMAVLGDRGPGLIGTSDVR